MLHGLHDPASWLFDVIGYEIIAAEFVAAWCLSFSHSVESLPLSVEGITTKEDADGPIGVQFLRLEFCEGSSQHNPTH